MSTINRRTMLLGAGAALAAASMLVEAALAGINPAKLTTIYTYNTDGWTWKVRMYRNAMVLTPVKSSNIKAVGYDAKAQALTVQFHSGAQHVYEGVPPEKHAAMMKPDASVGKYFHAHIKDAHKSSKLPE